MRAQRSNLRPRSSLSEKSSRYISFLKVLEGAAECEARPVSKSELNAVDLAHWVSGAPRQRPGAGPLRQPPYSLLLAVIRTLQTDWFTLRAVWTGPLRDSDSLLEAHYFLLLFA
jgi:hypothetical protein